MFALWAGPISFVDYLSARKLADEEQRKRQWAGDAALLPAPGTDTEPGAAGFYLDASGHVSRWRVDTSVRAARAPAGGGLLRPSPRCRAGRVRPAGPPAHAGAGMRALCRGRCYRTMQASTSTPTRAPPGRHETPSTLSGGSTA